MKKWTDRIETPIQAELICYDVNGIQIVFGVTEENELKLFHFSRAPFDAENLFRKPDNWWPMEGMREAQIKESSQLVQVNFSGYNRPYEKHGNKYIVTAPGFMLKFDSISEERDENGDVLRIVQKDGVTGAKVESVMQFYDGLSIARMYNTVTNEGNEDQTLEYPTKPTIVMVIGVNGAGKTTTIGKLCHQLKGEGKKVLVAAADTFRAAAIDQLEVWTQRAGVDIVKHAEGSDPASVVYDAIDAAKARGCDVLICDTAGRLHNKKNLMQELAKINRIIETRAEGCHQEILLVLDATTGQNAVNQARLFQEVADISGIVLTKLDGTAKGGIIVSIRNELGIPVKLVGVGEKIDDLQPFHAQDFVRALFEPTEE